MEKSKAAKSPFSKFLHVGVVVRDIDKAIEYLSSLSFGPFESGHPPRTTEPSIFRGKPFNAKLRVANTSIGGVAIELLQPVEGDSPAKEFLDKRGEGIQHIGLAVADLDKEVAKLTKQGVKVIWSAKTAGGGMAYLETDEVGGFLIELIQEV